MAWSEVCVEVRKHHVCRPERIPNSCLNPKPEIVVSILFSIIPIEAKITLLLLNRAIRCRVEGLSQESPKQLKTSLGLLGLRV